MNIDSIFYHNNNSTQIHILKDIILILKRKKDVYHI